MLARFRAALDACAVSALALLVAAALLSLSSVALGEATADSANARAHEADAYYALDKAFNQTTSKFVVEGTLGVTEPVSVDDNAGSLTVDSPQLPAALGAGVEAGALRVTIATDSTGVVSIDDNAASLTVDSPQLPAALTVGGNLSCAVAEELPAGTQNIGDVDVLSLPALVAGTANIGDVDVLTVPAPLNVVGTGTEATALRVTIASDSTGVVSVDDNTGSLTIDSPQLPAALSAGGGIKAGIVDALPAGDANVGNVDIVTVPAPLNVVGTGLEATALRVTIATDSTGLVSVDDGAGSLTVDGTVTVTDGAGDLTVDGTVTVGAVPAPLNVVGTGLEATALRVTIASDSTGVVSVDDNAGSLTVDGTVAVSSVPAPLSTTGTGLEATALRVTIATDSTGVLSVDDNAGSLTVDGTVTVGAITAGDTNIGNIDVLTVPAPLNVVGTGLEATALRVTLASDSTGVLSVDDNAGSLTVDGSVSLAAEIPAGVQNIGDVDVASVPAPLNVTGTGLEATALRVTIATDSTGVLSVDDGGGALTVDGTVTCTDGAGDLTVDGTVTVGSITAGDNNIGNVDIVTLPALVTGTAMIGYVGIKGSTGAAGGAPLADSETTTVSNCAANGTTTFTPAAGTYEICATTSGADVLAWLCYTDDGGSGTDCATKGDPYNASSTKAGCKIKRLANVAHYCRGDAAADFTLIPQTY